MDVTKKTIKILHSFLFFILALQNTFAEMMEAGKTKIKTIFNLYHQNSNDGNQVADNSGREETNVVEPMIFIEHQINEDTAINGRIVFDAWTAASDTKLDNYTGASGTPIMGQARVSANLGARQEKKVGTNVWNYGFDVGFSSEYDYTSLNGTLSASRSFANDNFTLGGSFQYYNDEVSLFKDISPPSAARISTGLSRKIMAASLTASQILTVRDIIQFDATFARSKGYLESTANTVNIAGVREVEVLPDTRSRYALSSKWVHGLSKMSALNLSYRYYWDQWDINAHTVRGAYLFDIEEDESFMEIFARIHKQNETKYFKGRFAAAETFMTSDSDMASYESYEGGVFYESMRKDFKVLGVEFEDVTWSHSLVYSTRTNGLRYGYYQTGFGFKF
ncbi:MAG: DUF3570 domain-containing protein [Bacteriovoracaceae bacterium]|nr:DUF3570 domain-containing protein [Bacteriovoracaceae bacterium]